MSKMILAIVSVLAAFSVQAAATSSAVGGVCSFEYAIYADGKPSSYQELKIPIGQGAHSQVSNLRSIRYRSAVKVENTLEKSERHVTTDVLKVGDTMDLWLIGIKKNQNGQFKADVMVDYSYSELMSLRKIGFAESNDDYIEAPEVQEIERMEYLSLKSAEILNKVVGTLSRPKSGLPGDERVNQDVVLSLKLKTCHL